MVEKIKQQIVQAYSGLKFEEKVHLYFWNGVRVLKSVSKKVEHYVPPFDEKYWAEWCSQRKEEYLGKTPHEIIHGWQTINEEACALGSRTHTFLENYTGHQVPTSPQEVAGVRFLRYLMTATFCINGKVYKKYTILFKELRAYSRLYKFAGTMDLLVYDHEINATVIFDYKTNKDMFRIFGWMKAPFDFLQNHAYNHYQVQLSYYSILLEEIGITVADRMIVYLTADEEYTILPLENYTVELKLELEKEKRQAA